MSTKKIISLLTSTSRSNSPCWTSATELSTFARSELASAAGAGVHEAASSFALASAAACASLAAAVTAAMCVVTLLILGYRGMPLQIEQSAWLFLVSLAGAWSVLAAAKFWEGSRGERMLRHFILMTVGLGGPPSAPSG